MSMPLRRFSDNPSSAIMSLEFDSQILVPSGVAKKYVDTNLEPTNGRARTRSEQRRTLQRRGTNRSDRYGGPVRPVSSGQSDEDPTNARLGGTPSGQAHLVLP